MIGPAQWRVIPLLILLVGCGPSTEEIKEREEVVILEHAKGIGTEVDQDTARLLIRETRERLKDPDSAQFRNLGVSTAVDDNGEIVGAALCGELNSRNSMGGYVGFRSFYAFVDYTNGEFELSVKNDDDRTESFMSLYRLICNRPRSVPTP